MAYKTGLHEITLDGGATRILYNPKRDRFRMFCNDKGLHGGNGIQTTFPHGSLGDKNVREAMVELGCAPPAPWVGSPHGLKSLAKRDAREAIAKATQEVKAAKAKATQEAKAAKAKSKKGSKVG